MGAIVDFAWDNKDIFWGFVFSAECTSDTTVSVKAYDFERYLKSEGSVVFQSGTLGDRYSNVCRRFGVPFNIREQPTYRVPAEVCDGKTGFDMIKSWGQIVKVVNAKNKANWAQMVQQANDELKKRNVSERKLTLDCIGDTSLIAGAGANVKIKDFGKTWTNCPILKATHNFGTDYTCSLEMKVGTKWQENSL